MVLPASLWKPENITSPPLMGGDIHPLPSRERESGCFHPHTSQKNLKKVSLTFLI
jgi:hypothetical protein